MLRAISNFFSAPPYQQEAHALYLKIVEQSRQPQFYSTHEVPDTLDGRFDMITLHMFLITSRLKDEGTPESVEFLRTLSEVFFADMDRSLREMGSTDTGVGKRIKKMSQAFYGRLLAYQTAADNDAQMEEAILRNLYRGDMGKQAEAHKMVDYVHKRQAELSTVPMDALLSAQI